jgi:hypothetical protein
LLGAGVDMVFRLEYSGREAEFCVRRVLWLGGGHQCERGSDEERQGRKRIFSRVEKYMDGLA